MATYFSSVGPKRGPIHDRATSGAIGVLESRTNKMPMGMALGIGWDQDGLELRRLTVRGAPPAGLWVVVDQAFQPVVEDVTGQRNPHPPGCGVASFA